MREGDEAERRGEGKAREERHVEAVRNCSLSPKLTGRRERIEIRCVDKGVIASCPRASEKGDHW